MRWLGWLFASGATPVATVIGAGWLGGWLPSGSVVDGGSGRPAAGVAFAISALRGWRRGFCSVARACAARVVAALEALRTCWPAPDPSAAEVSYSGFWLMVLAAEGTCFLSPNAFARAVRAEAFFPRALFRATAIATRSAAFRPRRLFALPAAARASAAVPTAFAEPATAAPAKAAVATAAGPAAVLEPRVATKPSEAADSVPGTLTGPVAASAAGRWALVLAVWDAVGLLRIAAGGALLAAPEFCARAGLVWLAFRSAVREAVWFSLERIFDGCVCHQCQPAPAAARVSINRNNHAAGTRRRRRRSFGAATGGGNCARIPAHSAAGGSWP